MKTADNPKPAIVEGPVGTEVFEVPKKRMVLLLRWVVVIVCSYLLLYSVRESLGFSTVHYFITFYILSNAVLYFVDEKLFATSYFYCPLVLFDTFCVTVSIMLSGQAATDFYLIYFLIIILCAVWQDFHGLIVVAVLVNLVYGYMLFQHSEVSDPSIYLRMPFLFVVALFYGYFVQIARGEKANSLRAQIRAAIAEQVAEASRLKSEFLTATTMEFRTPITAIVGYGDLLIDGAFGPVTESQKRALGRLMENARGMLGLVEEILDNAPERKEATLFMKPQEVLVLVDLFRRELAALESNRSYKIQYEIEERIPPIVTDWGLLRRILINILTNAVKFTYDGEVRLSVKNGSRGGVCFVVFQSGLAIPKTKFPLIIETYRELVGSAAARDIGIGPDLAISKNLLDLIGGKLEIESEAGKGSTFTLTIPSLEPKHQMAAQNFTWIAPHRRAAVSS